MKSVISLKTCATPAWPRLSKRSLTTRIQTSLKYPNANFDEILYDPERQLDHRIIEELAKCEWIDHGRNLLVTGQTGSGKSCIGNALCISALCQFKTAKYTKASHLIAEMEKAETLETYTKLSCRWPHMICWPLMISD